MLASTNGVSGNTSPLEGEVDPREQACAAGVRLAASRSGGGCIPLTATEEYPPPQPSPSSGEGATATSAVLKAAGFDPNALDPSPLYKLMAWFSPSFPIGAFSYSSGLEWAVEAGDVTSAETLLDWLDVMLRDGAGFCDGVFFAHAWRACTACDDDALRLAVELAAALSPSRERYVETTAQGRAFLDATRAAWPCAALDRLMEMGDALAYPVVAGAAAAGHRIALELALPAYLQALAANWISAGMRLVPLGQTAGQRVLAAIEASVAATAGRALVAALDDIGSAAFRADLASMRHETQYTRLFRS